MTVRQVLSSTVRRWNLAQAAPSPARAAAAGPAATAPAATPSSAASAATATAAAAPRDLHVAANFFLIEEMESSETDVGQFFFTERDLVIGHEVQFLWRIHGRYGRCGSASC